MFGPFHNNEFIPSLLRARPIDDLRAGALSSTLSRPFHALGQPVHTPGAPFPPSPALVVRRVEQQEYRPTRLLREDRATAGDTIPYERSADQRPRVPPTSEPGPREEHLPPPDHFTLGVAPRIVLGKTQRTGQVELPVCKLAGRTCEEITQKLFDLYKANILGFIQVEETAQGRHEPVLRSLSNEEKTLASCGSAIVFDWKKEHHSVTELSERLLARWTAHCAESPGNLLKLKIYKYGIGQDYQAAKVYEAQNAAVVDGNRANAEQETAVETLAAELRHEHRDTWIARQDISWSMWASVIHQEKDPQRRQTLRNAGFPPVGMFHLFTSPEQNNEEELFRVRHLSANRLALRAVRGTVTFLQEVRAEVTSRIERLEIYIDSLVESTPAEETRESLHIAAQIRDMPDVDHADPPC